MSAQCCRVEAGRGSRVARCGWQRTKTTSGLGVPAVILAALVLKCPICVAAYLALLTGLEISMGAAVWLRMAVIAVCIFVLALVAMRSVRLRVSAR
jgi:uncharacterized protein (DUF983 family)